MCGIIKTIDSKIWSVTWLVVRAVNFEQIKTGRLIGRFCGFRGRSSAQPARAVMTFLSKFRSSLTSFNSVLPRSVFVCDFLAEILYEPIKLLYCRDRLVFLSRILYWRRSLCAFCVFKLHPFVSYDFILYLEIVPASFSLVFVLWLNECCVAVATALVSRPTVSRVALVCEACAYWLVLWSVSWLELIWALASEIVHLSLYSLSW